jgi:hypothetical protein
MPDEMRDSFQQRFEELGYMEDPLPAAEPKIVNPDQPSASDTPLQSGTSVQPGTPASPKQSPPGDQSR